jgi:ribosomal protein S18 acetylase RimI-like enzyme
MDWLDIRKKYQKPGWIMERMQHLSPKQFNDCYQVVVENMQSYNPSPEWKQTKEREMKDPHLWYLLFPYGFCSFVCCVDDVYLRNRIRRIPVLYLYELQVNQKQRGKGVGSEVLQIVESIACDCDRVQVRLTVHKENQRAISFYQRHDYVMDSTCPCLQGISAPYFILSKAITR